MSEKAPMKISLSTFFLVIAILIIIVMGIYLYIEKTNSIKTITELENNNADMETTINNLQSKIDSITNTISSDTSNTTTTQTQATTIPTNTGSSSSTTIPTNTSSSSSTTTLTYNSLKGTYEGTVISNGETGKVYLTLCANGMYLYEDIIGTECDGQGYYTFNDNELTLHQIVRRANDPGVQIQNEIINLKLNDNNSFTDNKLNTVLKKSSDTVQYEVDICATLKNALDNGLLN